MPSTGLSDCAVRRRACASRRSGWPQQRCGLPARQKRQLPHGARQARMTWSPTCGVGHARPDRLDHAGALVAEQEREAVGAIGAALDAAGRCGRRPLARMRTSTSLGPGSSIVIGSTSAGSLATRDTTARPCTAIDSPSERVAGMIPSGVRPPAPVSTARPLPGGSRGADGAAGRPDARGVAAPDRLRRLVRPRRRAAPARRPDQQPLAPPRRLRAPEPGAGRGDRALREPDQRRVDAGLAGGSRRPCCAT